MNKFKYPIPEIALGFLLGIVLSIFVGAVSSYQTEQCEKANQAETNRPQLQNGQRPVAQQRSSDRDKQVTDNPKHEPYFACGAGGLLKSAVGFMDSHEGFFVGFFTFVLAAFTAWLVRATIGLWKSAENDTRILQRAYLSAEPGGVQTFKDGTGRLVAIVKIRNAGNLPANRVGWFIDRKVSSEERLSVFTMGQVDGNIVIAPQTIAPKGTKNLDDQEILGPKQLSSDMWLYVWGRIEYFDGITDKRRFIEFCHRYHVKASDDAGEISETTARFHEHGNHTDDG